MSLLIRDARAEDKPAVIELTRTIWEGEDYLPYVFDDWLETTSGEFFVLELDGRLAGLGRALVSEEGDAWLEGGRIHPELQGQGLASVMFAYQMHKVRRLGCRAARFTTASDNLPVQHLATATGFQKITDSSLCEADPGGDFNAVVLGKMERDAAWDMIQASDWWKATDGLKCAGWVWEVITPARFDAWLQAGDVWGWLENGQLAGVMIASRIQVHKEVVCGLATGSASAMTALAGALRARATGEYKHVEAIIPVELSATREAFEAAGYRRLYEDLEQSLFHRVMKT